MLLMIKLILVTTGFVVTAVSYWKVKVAEEGALDTLDSVAVKM